MKSRETELNEQEEIITSRMTWNKWDRLWISHQISTIIVFSLWTTFSLTLYTLSAITIIGNALLFAVLFLLAGFLMSFCGYEYLTKLVQTPINKKITEYLVEEQTPSSTSCKHDQILDWVYDNKIKDSTEKNTEKKIRNKKTRN